MAVDHFQLIQVLAYQLPVFACPHICAEDSPLSGVIDARLADQLDGVAQRLHAPLFAGDGEDVRDQGQLAAHGGRSQAFFEAHVAVRGHVGATNAGKRAKGERVALHGLDAR